jgi:hypothetical protein
MSTNKRRMKTRVWKRNSKEDEDNLAVRAVAAPALCKMIRARQNPFLVDPFDKLVIGRMLLSFTECSTTTLVP